MIYLSSAWTLWRSFGLLVISLSLFKNRPNASNTSGCSVQKGGQDFREFIEDQNVTFPNQKQNRFQVMKSQARNMEWKIWSQPWSILKGNMEWNTFWFQPPPRSYWFKYQLNNTKLNIHTWSSWPVEDSNCNKRSHLTLQKMLLQKGVRQTYDSYSLNPSLSVNFLSTTSLKLRVSVWSWMFPNHPFWVWITDPDLVVHLLVIQWGKWLCLIYSSLSGAQIIFGTEHPN